MKFATRRVKAENLMIWFSTGILLVLITIIFDLHIFTSSNFDGKTMLLSGEKILTGNLSEVYSPIEGHGPFTYSPFSFPFFSLHFFIQKHLLFNLNSFLNFVGLAFTTYSCLSKVGSQTIHSFVTLFITILSFGFVIQESLNIQQLDLFFLCFLFGFIANPKARLNILFCIFLLFIKPQLFLFPLLALLYVQRKSARVIAASGILFLFMQFLFFKLNNTKWSTFLNLWRDFAENAVPISQNFDVTNQSLNAVINRLICSPNVGGRYFPSDYTSTPIKRINLFTFNRSTGYFEGCGFQTIILINLLLFGIACFVFLRCLYVIHEHPIQNRDSIIVQLSILLAPFYAPLFWNVYFIYLIPVLVTFCQHLSSRQTISFSTPLLLLATCANRRVLDANFVDSSLYLGVTFFYWFAFFIIFSLNRNHQVDSMSRVKVL